MADEFKDIEMLDFDQTQTRHADGDAPAVYRMAVRLSEQAPPEWAGLFNAAWRTRIFSAKREALVDGQYLQVTCVPERFGADLKPEFLRVFAETNKAYREHLLRRQTQKAVDEAKRKQEEEKLAAIKKIKF